MQPAAPTSYLERLNIPTEQIEQFLQQPRLSLFQAAIAVLLIHGQPLPLADLAERLEALGFVSGIGDMERSLRKAWHGQRPVYRDDTNRFGLDLHTPEMEYFLLRLRLYIRDLATKEQPTPSPSMAPADDARPLTPEELDTAFRDRFVSSLSVARQTAAVLDALARRMTAEEIHEYLGHLTPYRTPITAEALRHGHSPLIYQDPDGRLSLCTDHPDLRKVRREVRRIAEPTLRQKEREVQVALRLEKYRREQEEEERRHQQEWESWRRGILHVVPHPDAPAAAVLLDIGKRRITTFVGSQLGELSALLAQYDWLAGLSIRSTLNGLGVDPERLRLAELSPAQKTLSLNRRGRKLEITPELVIASTTGISRPLGDPDKIAQYMAARQETKLVRRLASTAKALYAFYQQGALHGYARLRWGFVDECLQLGWDNRGEPSVRRTLEQARESGAGVEIVTGAVPGWEEPWARARRVTVLSLDMWTVWVREEGREMQLPYDEIRAIRLAGAIPQSAVAPGLYAL